MNKEKDKKESKKYKHHGLQAIFCLALTIFQLLMWGMLAEGIKQDNTPSMYIFLGMLPLFMTAILGVYHAWKVDTDTKGVNEE